MSRLPLVFLPGTACDEQVFAPLLDRLDVRDHRVVHASYDGARSVDDAVARLGTAWPARAIVVGFSLGGIIALALARALPDRVAALILIGANARPVDSVHHDARRAEADRARAAGLECHVRDQLLPAYLAKPGDRAHRAAILAMAQAAGAERFADQIEIAVSREDARSWLPTLALPVLVVGGAQDGINPPEVQAELAHALPDATLALIDGAGHFTPLEQPGRLAAHIATWLGQIDASPILSTKETQR